MLNRRHLRIKVLQTLYSWYQSDEKGHIKGEKELLISINKIYDLYISYLLVFEELTHLAEMRIEDRKNKKLPTADDLNPNLKFIQNPVFLELKNNISLKKEAEKRKINWQSENDMMRQIMNQIYQSEIFEAYMSSHDSVLSTDKEFAIKIFTDFIANNDLMLHYLEEKSVFWNDDIDLVCSIVIKTIQSIKENSSNENLLVKLYKDEEADIKFVKDLYRLTIQLDKENEELISSKAQNWENERIAIMDLILMKMALTEVKEFSSIPIKVTLNEYIEISKFYSTPKSNGFINGILDKAFIELKANGDIKKVGRGLLED